MKHFHQIFFLLLLIQKWEIFLQAETNEDNFIKTKGVQLILNGNPFYSNGFNAYWLMYVATDPNQRNKISSVFQQAANHGLTVARTWAFNDADYKALQISPGSYNELTFQGLDFVISEAKKYGIKMILSLVNNYENFGGKKQYVEWGRSEGQSIENEDGFFTNFLVKQFYKNHIKTVLTRRNSFNGIAYKDDPTIMAWELINEPRCPSDLSGKTIQAWITEMASYLKSIDENHLLEVGLEGFYGESSHDAKQVNPNFKVGTDFISNNLIPGIDFATIHSYPDQWLPGSDFQTQMSFLENWSNTHIQDAQNILQKPLIFAEFGASWKEHSAEQRDRLFNTVYSGIYESASSGGAAVGGMFWQLLDEGMESLGDGYEVILSQNSSTANLIAEQSQKLIHIRKMYARLRNIEKWKRAREVRRAENHTGNKG